MTLSYFLGTGEKNGFFSCFPKPSPENEGEYTYYLKGGPGSGKSTMMKKIRRYASRTASKKISRLSSKIGKEEKRLMEAITPKGFLFKNKTAEKLCAEAVIFDDDFGCAAEILLDELKNYALAAGCDVTISPFAGDGKSIRHIIIRELSLGFFTKDIFCSPAIIPSGTVS